MNILVGGEAGQGLVTIGTMLAKSLVRHGLHIVVTQDYQSRIRGGHNAFVIRTSDTPLSGGCAAIDLLVALTEETITQHADQLASHAVVMADAKFPKDYQGALKVPYAELAPRQYENTAALGVIAALIGLEESSIAQLLRETFGKKGNEVVEKNIEALTKAYAWGAAQKKSAATLPKVSNPEQRLMMDGNEASVLGALAAGIKFYAFYPMTPATSISLGLAAHAKHMGIMVEQAEDEIAAINMAIGAAYAGAPSMVATSGGGFALMVEGVSLAAMIETPIVIAVAQRPAPATGLPTRTEQADLDFVLHSGHGEFPRAIFAPGTVEECFHLTHKAFVVAEESQGPVFILTDQYLADSYRAVAPFDLDACVPVQPIENARRVNVTGTYARYQLTESGVSPRLLPGVTEHLVVADSDEHTEDGHLTEDLGVRVKMVEKRLAKEKIILKNAVPPDYTGDAAPDVLLVTWGSTKGPAEESVTVLRAQGTKAAQLNFSQVWPLVPDQFMKYLANAKRVVAVEGNAFGQFARLIRRETGFEIKEKILRYDGLPLTAEWIVKKLQAM